MKSNLYKIMFLLFCSLLGVSMQILFSQLNFNKKFLNIAHRGFSANYPENTLISFKKAIEEKADMLELDVHLSKDKELIVIHDDTFDRTSNGKGNVSQLTLKEIKNLDAGSWFNKNFVNEKIPTLEEVLKEIKGKVLLNIELKCSEDECVKKTISAVEKFNMVDEVILSSFNHQTLVLAKKINPKIKTAALVMSVSDLQKIINEIKPDAINPNYTFIKKFTIKKIHEAGLKINVWTVNDEASIKRLIEWGVDGIISNYPDKVKKISCELKL